jgi:ferric-dicitrate binding protein FerR (iron transport regulator)
MSQQELTHLLQQYFSKNITPAQQQALAKLIASHASEDQLKASVEALWNQYQPQEQLPAATSEAYYQRIMHQLQQLPAHETTMTQPARPVHRVHFLQRSWVRMAVAATVLAATGAIVFYMLPGGRHQQQQATTPPLPNKPMVRNVTLADGSHILLQANSQLQYPAAFTGSTREVTLTGEAYFDVAHNPGQPFIIHSGNVTTTVLGTAFNIKAWPAEKEVTVTVTRGKVKVENAAGQVSILTPNEQVSVDTKANTSKQLSVNAEETLSWKRSEYTLDDLTLTDAITELEMRYGMLIELADGETPGNCRFTASFKQDESLDYVLDVVCKIYQASWKKQHDKIVISHVKCNQ